MKPTNIWDVVGILSCGIFCLVLLVALLALKAKNKPIEYTHGRGSDSGGESRNIDGNHVYTWQEGDGEGIVDTPLFKSPYLRGADEKAEAWTDWANRHGVRPFGSDSADAHDRDVDQANFKTAWDAAHDKTEKNGPEVIDTDSSQNTRKEWH